jgi:hypothetical protein
MDIFGKTFSNDKFLLTPMKNSTCSAEGKLCNVIHTESELTPLLYCPEGSNIINIDSNFGHHTQSSYSYNKPVKKSNRGRKKKLKVKSRRKLQGDGSEFNSQIQFTILGECVREIPDRKDAYSKKAVRISATHEIIKKGYKIKVFRNGKITGEMVSRPQFI